MTTPQEPEMGVSARQARFAFEAWAAKRVPLMTTPDGRYRHPDAEFAWEAWQAALAAPAADGWRPIESAPKDGTRVLVFHPGNPHADNSSARRPEIQVDWYKPARKVWWREPPEARHSHWMPLPAAPHAQGEG